MGGTAWGGRYQSQAVVAETPAGQWHIGWDRSLHRPVCLGVRAGVSAAEWEVLLQDIRLAAGREWESLPELYDVGLEDGCAYIVMERKDGRPFWEEWRRTEWGIGRWLGDLLRIAEGALRWSREGVRCVSIDCRWIWVDENGRFWFYGLGQEDEPLPRQLARLAVQLAARSVEVPSDWEVVERRLKGVPGLDPLWIQAFGHWWVRAASSDPGTSFADGARCVEMLREVVGACPATRPKPASPVPERRMREGGRPEWVRRGAARSRPARNPAETLEALRARLGGWSERLYPSKPAMWLILALVALFGGASLGYAMFMKGPGEVTMPFVVGKPYDAAVAELVKAGFDPSKVVKEPQPSAQPPGTVIAQDPFEGKVVKADRTVRLQVAVAPESVSPVEGTGGTGGERTEATPSGSGGSGSSRASAVKKVPDLTGLTLQEAQNRLLSLGIHYRYEIVASDRPKDTVIEQSPPPGTAVGDADQVLFRVSRGS